MFTDQQLLFSTSGTSPDTGVVWSYNASAQQTNCIDFGVARDLGAGEPFWLYLGFLSQTGTNPTIAIVLQAASAQSSGTLTSPVTKWTCPTLTNPCVATATPVATQYVHRIDPGAPYRYWALSLTLAVNPSSVTLFAGFVKDVEVKWPSRAVIEV